ncbi:MAG: Sulfotransferase domain protein [bacterium ADurb.Bin400]|nr:MAG: Sulfotransferase domain protein [bacterium ADurb.Bin400]
MEKKDGREQSPFLLKEESWLNGVDYVFLVGAPRSGTTWLQALLSSFPEVYTGLETHFFEVAASLRKTIWNRQVGVSQYWNEEHYHRLLELLFKDLIFQLPKPQVQPKYFLEKTPGHCDHAEMILKVFPRAKFIHIIRDGRAVSASMLRVSKSWGRYWAPSTADEAARRWKRNVDNGLAIRDLVQSPDHYYQIKYEDLRGDTGGELKKMLKWVGIRATTKDVERVIAENSLDKFKKTSQYESIPAWPNSGKKSGERSGFPEGFAGPAPVKPGEVGLTYVQRLQVDYYAGDLLVELGYPGVRRRFRPWELATIIGVRWLRKIAVFLKPKS